MDEQPSIEVQLALFAVGEALRARAEGLATWYFLKNAGVPGEALNQAYITALRDVIEEARVGLKAQGMSASSANTIADRLLSSLPAAERSGRQNGTEPN